MTEPCESCYSNSPFPGVLWPIRSDDDGFHRWVERCDECARFPDDYAAAEAMAEYFDLAGFQVGRVHGGSHFQPYFDLPLTLTEFRV
jgi:hypothetical protein